MARNVLSEVTVTFDLWLFDICAKFKEIPSRLSCDIAFTRIRLMYGRLEHVMPPAEARRHNEDRET